GRGPAAAPARDAASRGARSPPRAGTGTIRAMPAPAPNEPALDLSPSPGDEVKATTCYMCACRCGIKVWLRDGSIRYLQGNAAHPVNKGVICAKGAAGIMQHNS